MDALSIGAAGIASATARFTTSARRTANGTGDLVSETVEQAETKTAFEASAAIVKTSDDMLGSLLDMRA